MKRREFITLIGGFASGWPRMSRAQSQMPLIGVLRNSSESDAAFRMRSFRQGLSELGFVDGQNVSVEYRYADSQYERLPGYAQELIRKGSALLFASGNASALAAKRATSETPVVFAVGNDPVQMGLVGSLSRPEGNVTGISFFTILIGKRLEVMRELVAKRGVIAYLQDTNNPVADLEVRDLEVAARTLGQSIVIFRVGSSAEIETTFRTAAEKGVTGLIIAAGSFQFKWMDLLIGLATRHALPAIYAGSEVVKAGGLISYSGSQAEAHRLAGIYCARILKGDTPRELPVQLPDKLELTLNLKAAKALGLTVPPALLARADEVIE